MRAANESDLFNFDDFVESAFVQILSDAQCFAQPKRGKNTEVTPRTEVMLTVGAVQGRRFARNPGNSNATAQPFNTWHFTLECEVISNRSTNGDKHSVLVARAYCALQYYRLILTWTEAVAPHHALSNIQESAPRIVTFNSDDNTDSTKLTFAGLVNIRDDAWTV